jgi:Uma2 family endonuclease
MCVGMAVDLRRDDWTLADLARLPEDGYRYEIIDGELVVSPPPTNFHQRVATEMIRRWQPTLGVLTHAAGVSVPAGRYRERFLVPDVLVVRNGVSSPYYVPSDVLVAVEIVSPSSVTRDR